MEKENKMRKIRERLQQERNFLRDFLRTITDQIDKRINELILLEEQLEKEQSYKEGGDGSYERALDWYAEKKKMEEKDGRKKQKTK